MSNRNPIKLAAFDFDGVLIDSLDHNIRVTNDACSLFGAAREISKSDLQQIDRMAFDDVARFVGVPQKHFQECLAIINRKLVETYHSLKPFDGIPEAMQKISKTKITTAIVTHNTSLAVDAFLAAHGMTELFNIILGAEDEGEKDHKLTSLCKKFSVNPAEAVMIGDSVGDIQSAIAAQLTPIGVSWGFQNQKKLLNAGAKIILEHPDNITPELLRIMCDPN